MCINCGYIRDSPKGKYCKINNELIPNNTCIKNLSKESIKKEIINQKLCLKKLGYNYNRICEESNGVCLICRELINDEDLEVN